MFKWCLCSVCVGSAKVSQVKTSSNGPKALIIEPSKELAEQTLNNVKQFKKYVDNPKLRYKPKLERINVPTYVCSSLHFEILPADGDCCIGNVSEYVCICRDLLVIGGVAAKEQLSALEQGVSNIKFFQENLMTFTTLYLLSPCSPVFFMCGFFQTRLISLWGHLADWMISYLLVNSVWPKSAF